MRSAFCAIMICGWDFAKRLPFIRLLSKDISDETGQGFSATFSGREFFSLMFLYSVKAYARRTSLEMARRGCFDSKGD